MALLMRSRPRLSGPCSLSRKFLPLGPRCCSGLERSFQTYSPFSTLQEHTYSGEGARGDIESISGLLSQVQSTKDEKNNAWLYNLRNSTLEKIRNGSIPLPENHSMRSFAPAAPCKVNHITKYKVLKFEGKIVYCRTASEVEEASMELLDKIKAMNCGGVIVPLGFDTEWKPTFIKGGTVRKTAVMQICIDKSCCYVMHIIHSGIPSTLKSLLENNSSVEVGIGIAGDATKIVNDYDVRIQSLKDLSDLANTKLAGPRKKWSLSSLTETIIRKWLDKRSSIRLGNWEGLLSEKQLRYAATDAFVSWQLHELLNGMPDLEIEKEYLLEREKKNRRKKKRKRAHCLAKL